VPAPSPEAAAAAVRAALEAALGDLDPARRRLAVSGGRDSSVLLAACAAWHRDLGAPPPKVLHVDHGLDPASGAWAGRVARAAAALGAPCTIVPVTVAAAGEGPEAAARRARLDAFADQLAPDEHLATAHHRDDQAETVLLRALRGAGPRGLAAIPRRRPLGAGLLVRPFLDLDRALLAAAAPALGVEAVDDPSNDDVDAADRNFLRHRVLPLLETRFPGSAARLARVADASVDEHAALAALIDVRLDAAGAGAGAPLPLAALDGPRPVALAVLRRWLERAGLPPPPRPRLETLADQLGAAPDARVAVDLPTARVARHAGALHLVASHPAAPREGPAAVLPTWADAGSGRLALEPVAAGGLRADRGLPRIAFRRGGERLAPAGRGTRVSLKQLLQEARVPPWERDRLPLLYVGEALVAVADRWIDAAWTAPPGVPGWRVRWAPTDGRDGSAGDGRVPPGHGSH
jgi:tRNA(Ile)-lysidine synthase